MALLQVTTYLDGIVIEDEVLAVRDDVWIGDAPSAAVSFPGMCVRVVRDKDGFYAQGCRIRTDRPVILEVGETRVRLQLVHPNQAWLRQIPVLDLRVLVATAALVLLGAWGDALHRFATGNEEVQRDVQALIQLALPDTSAPALEERPGTPPPAVRYRDTPAR